MRRRTIPQPSSPLYGPANPSEESRAAVADDEKTVFSKLFGNRSVQVFTVLGGIAAILALFTGGGGESQSPSNGGAGGTPSTSTGQTADQPSATSTSPSIAPAVKTPSFDGPVRITGGMNFSSGRPKPGDGAFATLAFTDYQDRLSEGGAAGSDEIAPWSGASSPTYEQCVTVLDTNGYGQDERFDLPKAPGSKFCVRHDDVIVFARVTNHEPETAVTINATVWD